MTGILSGIDAKIHVGWYGLDGVPSALVPGYGPSGVATLALQLEQGYTLTWGWPTDIIPSVAGGEQRIPRNNRPQELFSGGALLFGAESPTVHAKLAKFALGGNAFLLGLPHEALPLVADSAGTTVYVPRTDLSDWLKPGQRAVVVRNRQSINAVVQSTTANTVVLDIAPGAIGKQGGLIMPALAVYLDPKQDFDRYRTKIERWKIKAQAAIFGFARQLARLDLGPITASAALDNVSLTSRLIGIAGNTIMVNFLEDASYPAAGQLVEADNEVEVRFRGGVTTLAQLETLLLTSSYVKMTGTWNPASTLAVGAGDEFVNFFLTGGTDGGPVGTGAALTMYAGNPVWDRRLKNSGTNTDSINALTQVVDHGGIPYPVGLADQPIWGRAINHQGQGLAKLQWLKLFMVTVRGPAKVFWLSTWRDDLPITGYAGSTLTVSGDVGAWYPKFRKHLHVRLASGASVYCQITAATKNGDGTYTLTTDAAPFVSPVGVSLLELCRLDGESFPVTFGAGASFSLSWRASAVSQ